MPLGLSKDFSRNYFDGSGAADRPAQVHLGGPDQPRFALRNLLQQLVAGVPAGGRIRWATYYFRDLQLAEELIQAARRGVDVKLVLEARPRISSANEPVIRRLSAADGLGDGLKLVSLPGIPSPTGKSWKPQFHEKLYAFSHPHPQVLIGSFNPSGNGIVKEPIFSRIGDQDAADNLLVALPHEAVVRHIEEHIDELWSERPNLWSWMRRADTNDLRCDDTDIHFWPRSTRHPVVALIDSLSGAANLRLCASHMRSKRVIGGLIQLAHRGARVQLLVEATSRRVKPQIQSALVHAGIKVQRMRYATQQVPMHMKLILAEDKGALTSIFGSFNWTIPSFYLNHEVAVVSQDPRLYEVLDRRWLQVAHRTTHSNGSS